MPFGKKTADPELPVKPVTGKKKPFGVAKGSPFKLGKKGKPFGKK